MTSITVLMSVYEKDKDGPFIEAINSLILNKDFIDKTIIVINGSISKKKLNKIEKSLNLISINKIQLPINIGLSRALNIGLKKVETEWVARFDSDDISLPNRFKRMKEHIKKYGHEFDVIGTYIEEFNSKDSFKRIKKVPLIQKDITRNLLYTNPINHVSVFFKKSLISSIPTNDFYPLRDGFEDYALWFKLIYFKKRFLNIPEISVLVRADNEMLKRRGGLGYILGEIKFRISIFKYIPKKMYFMNVIVCFLRVLVFSSPRFIKSNLYRIKRS